jgi:hypothetical protein
MIRQTWLLLGLVSLGAIAPFTLAFTSSPANACSPNPNFPHLCDRLIYKEPILRPGGGGCPQCGPKYLEHREILVLPAGGLQPQSGLGSLNPQPLPPKAGQMLR